MPIIALNCFFPIRFWREDVIPRILPSSGHTTKRVISKTEVNNENKKGLIFPAVRNKYTAQFKEQALERADRDGIPKVAQDLGVAMLYSWRSKRRQTGQSFEEQKLQQAELARLKRENARLEEEVAFLKKAAAYFAKMPK
jgi:transposase